LSNYFDLLFYCADPYCKTEGALHSHYIMCYSEQYAWLKRSVFSPRRKADVDCVLFSSVGSWFHALGAAAENARSAVFRFPYLSGLYDLPLLFNSLFHDTTLNLARVHFESQHQKSGIYCLLVSVILHQSLHFVGIYTLFSVSLS